MTERQDRHSVGAVLAVDAVGYSRLMGKDEEATLKRLHDYRGLIGQIVGDHGGQVFGEAGDSEMAVFSEAAAAVRCAIEIQDIVKKRDAILPANSRMPVRIGVNYGQVIIEEDGVYGDDVNIAARLEAFAEAGEVCISGALFERVRGALDCGFDDFGEERFKNIAHRVRVYRVRTDPASKGQVIRAKRRRPRPGRPWKVAAAAALVALIGATAWGVSVQVEKRRAEATAAAVIADARGSAAEAERKVEGLLDRLRAAEESVTDEGARLESLLATLRAAQDQAAAKDGLAAERAGRVEDLLALLEGAEARAADERARAEGLLAALQDAEGQVAAAKDATEREKEARAAAERRATDRELVEALLASWRQAEEQAAAERARAEALLADLERAETQAAAERVAAAREAGLRREAEQQVALERRRTEELLAGLRQAHALAVSEREGAEALHARLEDARAGAAGSEAALGALGAEQARVEALLASLRVAEARVAAERVRAEEVLKALREAEEKAAPPPKAPGPAWREAGSAARARAEVLLASWGEAQQEAAAERHRAEDLLAALAQAEAEAADEATRAPPPLPPPKPAFEATVEEPAPAPPPEEPADAPASAPDEERSMMEGPVEAQLAYNLAQEELADEPRPSPAPVRSRAEIETYLRENSGELEVRLYDYLKELQVPATALMVPQDSAYDKGRVKIVEISVKEASGDMVLLEITYRWGGYLNAFAGPDSFATRWVDGELEFGALEAPKAEIDSADVKSLDGQWTVSEGDWRAELEIADGLYRLTLDCGQLHGVASGTVDESGRIYANLRSASGGSITTASGTIDRLSVVTSRNWHCPSATLSFHRDGDAPPGDARAIPAPFDGTWVGKGVISLSAGSACPGTLEIEMYVSGGRITGFKSPTTGSTWGTGHMTGSIDALGRFETADPLIALRGTLSHESGTGSGEWTKGDNNCQGTFELARVE